METIRFGKLVFDVVDSIPEGYSLWSIGTMVEGYLPLAQISDYKVNPDTLKAIKVDNAEKVMKALGGGQKTIKRMETYIKKYSKSKVGITIRRVNRFRAALEVLYTIDGVYNLVQ